MLATLNYNVRFPNGRSFDRSITFQAGQTAIIGANEQGKSLTLEMIRFCLFGSAALRGTAEDYNHLQADLTFSIRGSSHTVTRSVKNATLATGEGEVLARGTKPVNGRIIALLGFDLEVFDVACAANQGDVERLANMKPTARREMVDRLIGADRIEEIVDWTGSEALGLKREIDVLQRQLVEPQEPVRPDGWQDPVALRASIAEKQARRDQASQLRAWLANKPPAVIVPGEPPHPLSRAILDQAEDLLSRSVFDFDLVKEKQGWVTYLNWQARQGFERSHPRPEPGVTVSLANAVLEIQRLDQEIAGLEKSPKVSCPSCQHAFSLANDQMNSLMDQRQELSDHAGNTGLKELNWMHQRAFSLDWESLKTSEGWLKVKDFPEEAIKPIVSLGMIEDAEKRGISKTVLIEGLKALDPGLEDAGLAAVRLLRRQLDHYEAEVEAAGPAQERLSAWLAEEPSKRQALDEAVSLSADLDQDRALMEKIAIYETLILLYGEQKVTYENRLTEIEDKTTERASWLMGKEQLNEVRLRLKGFLAPSLSQAASALLSQMTRGARRSIWVSDAFEIEVDGQKLQTLSGSGKVCANLALRIGLAQVLTNNVLSVFIGDEMDAFMDMERVTALNECLERLGSRVGQIIVITHKPPMFKNVIDLGGGK